jgi:hypothetical protein
MRFSMRTTDSFTFLRNAPVARPMGLRGSYLVSEYDYAANRFHSDFGLLTKQLTVAAMESLLRAQWGSFFRINLERRAMRSTFITLPYGCILNKNSECFVQGFSIIWDRISVLIPVNTSVFSVCFRQHSFCLVSGDCPVGTVIITEERIVADATFWRWFCAAQKEREDQASGLQQGRRRDLESSKL